MEAVRKEIDFLTHIKHPNIIRLYEVYENTSEIFLVLELYVSRLLRFAGVLPLDIPRARELLLLILSSFVLSAAWREESFLIALLPSDASPKRRPDERSA